MSDAYEEHWVNPVDSKLEAHNLWYYIVKKQKGKEVGKKYLLRDVTMEVLSSKVVAIMGPSGAGKTMFLNALTLTRGPGKRYGNCQLNGQVFTNSLFEKYCSIVTQMDLQWPFLTCRQSLDLSANLFLSGSKASKQATVNALAKKSGMTDCMDTRIGNAFIPGLAFGQRRRLSLMSALLKNPLVVFLDEPTTNLDSASAAGIMAHLKVVATEVNIIIVCTIHQPDKHVFEGFDTLMLMSDGKVAYNGPAQDAEKWFGSYGHNVPKGVNPADYLLDLMNKSFTDPDLVDDLLIKWANHQASLKDSHGAKIELPPPAFGRGACGRMVTLFSRHFVLVFRDPSLYLGRMIMIIFGTCFFALCYIEANERVQDQALNRLWVMLWCMSVPGQLSVVACFALNMEFLTVRFEVIGGMYKLIDYIIATSLIQVPCMLVVGACATTISLQLMIQCQGSVYVSLLLTYGLTFWSYEVVAQLASVGKMHPLLAMMDFLNYFITSFLFCGMMIPGEDIIWPIRAAFYLLPMRYAIQTCVYLEFDGSEWDGAILTNETGTGFGCPGGPNGTLTSGIGCFGRTGKQALASIKFMFDSVDPDTDVARNLLFVGIICFVGKVLYVLVAYYRCRAVAPPAPPPPAIQAEFSQVLQEGMMVKAGSSPSKPALSIRGHAPELPPHACDSRVVFSAKNIWYVTKGLSGQINKKLLQDASLTVRSGEFCVVMGPSGSGKSLLLNTMTLVKGGSLTRFGTVKVNSTPFTANIFSRYGNQILQMDNHWPFMTPREQMFMAADLYSGASRQASSSKVDVILEKLGLSSCQHTRIGNQFVPGCSGGQRRRVSIGMAMISDPLVLFLDEPTAGLDSAAALNVVKAVKELALEQDVVTISTLSQPSLEIWLCMDQLVLLCEGQVAFSSSASKALPYFATMGYAPPKDDNPADFFVSLLNRGFADSAMVDNVLVSWQQNEVNTLTQVDPQIEGLPMPQALAHPNFFKRTAKLVKRHAVLTFRDPTLFTGRVVVNLLGVSFFCIIYIESRDAIQSQVMNRFFLNLWAGGVPTMLVLVVVFAYQTETVQVLTEAKSGMYGPLEYVLANSCLQLPMLIVIALCSFGAGFVIGNWDFTNFVQYWMVFTLGYWACEAAAQGLAVRPLHLLLNMMDYSNFWFAGLLFSGMILREDDVVWPMRLFCFILPTKYMNRSLGYLIVEPQDFEGAYETPSPFDPPSCPPDVNPAQCYGYKGCQVLETVVRIFYTFRCEDHTSSDMAYLCIIVGAWKLSFMLNLFGRATGLKPPKPVPDALKRDKPTMIQAMSAAAKLATIISV